MTYTSTYSVLEIDQSAWLEVKRRFEAANSLQYYLKDDRRFGEVLVLGTVALAVDKRSVKEEPVRNAFQMRLEVYAGQVQLEPAEVSLLECPNCHQPGVPEGHGRTYDFCLRCGWSSNLTEGTDASGMTPRQLHVEVEGNLHSLNDKGRPSTPFVIDRNGFLKCSDCGALPGEVHASGCSKFSSVVRLER